VKIGGLLRCSLIDYPGMIAAVIFTRGCNFRCPYCHNPGLVRTDDPDRACPERDRRAPDAESVLAFLERRRNRLDGVVLSGGEPTLQEDLIEFARAVKELGFAVKLDTNGSRPDVLENLLKKRLVDCVAMDVKAPPEKYELCAGTRVDIGAVRRSISLIAASGVEYCFRTTVARPFLRLTDLYRLKDFVGKGRALTLQVCRTDGALLDSRLEGYPQYTDADIERFSTMLNQRCGGLQEHALPRLKPAAPSNLHDLCHPRPS
jgi:pyruvate formate lyase activating enzyme